MSWLAGDREVASPVTSVAVMVPDAVSAVESVMVLPWISGRGSMMVGLPLIVPVLLLVLLSTIEFVPSISSNL